MARKLNPAEKETFYEVIREAEPSLVEINPDHFLRRLKEQEQVSWSANQLALWLSEDPLSQR
jgi:hypothetical protein